MSRLRVATWNIAGGRRMRSTQKFDYHTRDLAYFADQLRPLNLDIICLQESEISKHENVADQLATLLHMPHVFETKMHPSHIDPDCEISLAILSKKPLRSQRAARQPYPTFSLTLPNGQPAKRYVKYVQVVEYDGLCLANTQTQPLEFLGTPYESERGASYAKELSDFFLRELHRPLVFAGDFCADLHTKHVSTIYKDACATLELTDALPPGQTKPHQAGRADALFISPELHVLESAIIQTDTDHFLCWAEVEYAKK